MSHGKERILQELNMLELNESKQWKGVGNIDIINVQRKYFENKHLT